MRGGVDQIRQQLLAANVRPSRLADERAPLREPLSHAAIHHLHDIAPVHSARHRATRAQKYLFLGLIVIGALALLLAPITTLIVLNSGFIIFCLAVFVIRFLLLALSVRFPLHSWHPERAALEDDELPIVTILCPAYKEAEGLPGLIDALAKLDYPARCLDIKILLEEDDPETIATAQHLCTEDIYDLVITPVSQPRTKPKACNYALWSALGELIVIYDAEDRPEPNQLRLAANAFAALPDRVACLQARLNYYNREQTWITRLFAIEYALLFDLILPGLARLNAPLPLGGTSNIFRTQHLITMGGWDPHNVTEDADLGLRMAAAGFDSRTLDSTTYEEATDTVAPWLRQRSRWIKGYLQTWIVHTRRQSHPHTWQTQITLHFLVGGVVFAALFNPLFWALFAIWALGLGSWVDPLFPAPLNSIATFALLAGNLFHIWLFMLAPLRRQWFDLVPYALLAPIYWVLQSLAGYKALWQFLTRPFYWEKTDHGAGQSADHVMARARAEAAHQVIV